MGTSSSSSQPAGDPRGIWFYRWNSPLVRHPALALRKIRKRLGIAPSPVQPGVAAGRVGVLDGRAAELLREWLDSCALIPELAPADRVFGRAWGEPFLLGLCRESPTVGARGLESDVKLPWEFSRGYAHPLNAALSGRLGVGRVAEEISRSIRRWIDGNQDLDGVAWSCAMEVAIRAVNWIAADALTGGKVSALVGLDAWANTLCAHASVIWTRLEARFTANNNHYLSDLMGLVWLGKVLPDDPQVARWARFAAREFPQALCVQTYPDGSVYEASLPYHALVTEIALFTALITGVEAWPKRARARLIRMCRHAVQFRSASGDVFPFGDDDSGRIIAADFHMENPSRCDALRALAERILNETFEPRSTWVSENGGWWISREGAWTVAAEWGGTSTASPGGHAHNDTLSLAVECDSRPLLIDPGSYVYSSDIPARNRFRSVRAHTTVSADEREHVPLGSHAKDVFALKRGARGADATLSDSGSIRLAWSVPGQGGEIPWTRTVRVSSCGVEVVDRWASDAPHHLEWTFAFAPDLRVHWNPALRCFEISDSTGREWRLNLRGDTEGVGHLEEGEMSPGYGQRRIAPRGRWVVPAVARGEVRWNLESSKRGT